MRATLVLNGLYSWWHYHFSNKVIIEILTLCGECPNMTFFLVRIFLHSDWLRTRKSSVSGHFSCSVSLIRDLKIIVLKTITWQFLESFCLILVFQKFQSNKSMNNWNSYYIFRLKKRMFFFDDFLIILKVFDLFKKMCQIIVLKNSNYWLKTYL